MIKNYILVGLLASCFTSLGQTNHGISLSTGIDYSYRHLSTGDFGRGPSSIIKKRNDSEVGKLNWHFDVHYSRKILSGFWLLAGGRFITYGYKSVKNKDLRWPDEIGPDGFIPNPNNPREVQHFYNFRFIEFPIGGRYEAKTYRKLIPYFEMGISPSLLVKAEERTVTNLDNTTRVSDAAYHKMSLIGWLGFGSSYPVNSTIQCFAQSSFRYQLLRVNSDGNLRGHLYNIGIEIGARKMI